MRNIKKLPNKLLRYLDTFLTILIGITVAILNYFDVFGLQNSAIISSAILLTLIFVSISLLINRSESLQTRKSVKELTNLISEANLSMKPLIDKGFDLNRIIDLIVNSSTAMIFGSGHTVLLPLLDDKLNKDNFPNIKEIKILLMDPNGSAVNLAEYRARKSLRNLYIENSLIVQNLVSKNPNKILFSVIDFLPPYNIIVINPDMPSGEMFVRLSAWQTSVTDRPVIHFNINENQELFDFFIRQFNIMWDEVNNQ